MSLLSAWPQREAENVGIAKSCALSQRPQLLVPYRRLLVCCEPCLQGMVCHLRRKHDAGLGAERHGELTNEHVGLCRRKIYRGRLPPILNDSTARRALRLGRCLAVVLKDVEDDLLTLADEFDRVAFDDSDITSVGSLLSLSRRAMRDHCKEQYK